MSDENETPLLFETQIIGKEKKIEKKFTKDSDEIKVYLFEFTNDGEESVEVLLTLIKDFDNMVTTCDLFNELTVTKVINRC